MEKMKSIRRQVDADNSCLFTSIAYLTDKKNFNQNSSSQYRLMIVDYLLNNTKLDTASSSRHGFGEIFEENGELYFNLNLQIRFTKSR